MISRRDFLASLSAVPFAGWIGRKLKRKAPSFVRTIAHYILPVGDAMVAYNGPDTNLPMHLYLAHNGGGHYVLIWDGPEGAKFGIAGHEPVSVEVTPLSQINV